MVQPFYKLARLKPSDLNPANFKASNFKPSRLKPAADILVNLHPEPIPVYKFKVYLQMACLGFSKITNLEESVETEALQEGGVNDRVYSLTKPVTAEKVLRMERGTAFRGAVSAALSSQLSVGKRLHTDILITAHKRDGAIGKIFDVHGAVVKKISFSNLDAMSGATLIETFELAYETMRSFDAAAAGLGTAETTVGVTGFVL